MITFRTKPRNTNLTTLQAVKDELSLTDGSEDAAIKSAIARASDAFVKFTGRKYARAVVTEQLGQVDDIIMMLDYTPLILREAVRFKDVAIADLSDISIFDPEAGFLLNRKRWNDTVVRNTKLINRDPIPSELLPDYEVDYTAGFFVPDDNIVNDNTISASSTDDSFNITGRSFPLLVAGETFEVRGFADAANNGTFMVVVATATKITVEETLVTEAAGLDVDLDVRDLPFDIEQAVINAIVHLIESRGRDGTIKSERIGDWAATYFDRNVTSVYGADQSINKWVRVE